MNKWIKNNQEDCPYCVKPFHRSNVKDAVRGHCHMSGKYRGTAHSACNLKVRIRPEQDPIPLVVHNLKGYDAHLLFQEISKIKDKKLECIPQNGETYISFSFGGLRFIDSLNFLQESLDSLAKNLPTEALKYTAELAKNKTQRCLTGQKRVYPYEYI